MLKKLEWDSSFFNKEIYSFDQLEDLSNLNELKNCIIQKKINNNDILSEIKLKEKDFKYIGGHITLEFSLLNICIRKNLLIKQANINQLDEIKIIIKNLYPYSRFYKINAKKVDDFYFEWVKKAILGQFDDICFVYTEVEKIKGFITLKVKNKELYIGLIGVDKNETSKGIGKELLIKAIEFGKLHSCEKIVVATQTENKGAINFYKKNGYKIIQEEKWFYYKGGKDDTI